MPKVPDSSWTPEKLEKWAKDKKYAEERVEHLEDELDKALDEQEKLSHEAEELRGERDSEKRLRVQAENDARRAKAAADQAAAAAAAASRSLKIGEKQAGAGGKDGEVPELRVEVQQLKANNHGLNTQMDALAQDHERLAGLLAVADKDKSTANDEAGELRAAITTLEREKEEIAADSRAKGAEWEALVAGADAAKAEASRLEAQNHKLGDELDRLAGAATANAGQVVSPKDLAAAVKGREEAEERGSIAETQLSAVQTELRTAREELASLQDESEMRAGAAREGLEVADQQTVAITAEANGLRAELAALKEKSGSESTRRENLLQAMGVKVAEGEALKKEAEEKASASEARAGKLSSELSISQRSLEQKGSLGSIASAANEARDEEDTKDQVMEMVALLKDAEAAKMQALDDLSATKARLEEAQSELAAKDKQLDSLRQDISANTELIHELEDKLESDDRGYHANGDRALGASEANGDGASAAKITVLQEELDDLHAMLDNVASERDTALNDLRRAGEGGGSGGGNGDGAQEEVERLRDECDLLRDQLNEMETEQQELQNRHPAAIESKRVMSLEAQVERLSEEHTRQSETWRDFSTQMEMEKEELSQELISAKLQVAQLFMEVDGLKLRHRQEAVAATAARALELENAISPASTPPSRGPSPTSPHTMEL